MTVILSQTSIHLELPTSTAHVVLVDEPANTIRAFTPVDSAPEDTAYVIFTSGSTGRPKGVRIPHRAVVNFLSSMRREPGLTADDVLLSVTTLSFDISGLEIFLPLTTGAETVIATRETTLDGQLLADRHHPPQRHRAASHSRDMAIAVGSRVEGEIQPENPHRR